MNNNASGELFPLYAAIPLTKILFDLVVTEDEVLELSRLVLRQTRNAATKTYILRAVPIVDCHVQLPEDVFEIKGVFAADSGILNVNAHVPSHLFTIGAHEKHDVDVQALAHSEANLADEAELSNINKHRTVDFNFHFEAKELSFRQRSGLVNVIYTVRPVGCDGVEEVPEAVIEAIAYYVNFVDAQKRFLRGYIPMTIMEFALKQKDTKIAQARAGGRISANYRKKLLDTLHSMDRHQYGVPKR